MKKYVGIGLLIFALTIGFGSTQAFSASSNPACNFPVVSIACMPYDLAMSVKKNVFYCKGWQCANVVGNLAKAGCNTIERGVTPLFGVEREIGANGYMARIPLVYNTLGYAGVGWAGFAVGWGPTIFNAYYSESAIMIGAMVGGGVGVGETVANKGPVLKAEIPIYLAFAYPAENLVQVQKE